MRTRPGWVEPEVYFRIVHAAQDGHKGAPMAAYREQTIQIAPGDFENTNISFFHNSRNADAVSALNSVSD